MIASKIQRISGRPNFVGPGWALMADSSNQAIKCIKKKRDGAPCPQCITQSTHSVCAPRTALLHVRYHSSLTELALASLPHP